MTAEAIAKRNAVFSDFPPAVVEKIQVDPSSLEALSPAWLAGKICSDILELVGPSATITDGTACVGADALRFGRSFTRVNAVELSPQKSDILYSNVKAAALTDKVFVHNADYATIAGSLWQDVVYMDPPTEFTPLPSICKAVWPHCRFIVLKVSPSFNAEEFAASLRPEVADAVATACDLAGVRVVTLKHASSGSGGAEPPLKRSKA